MKRSTWTKGLEEMFISFLDMSQFEAGKAANIAAGHAVGPWDAERVVVPEARVRLGLSNQPLIDTAGPESWFRLGEAERAVEILNGYERTREAMFNALHQGGMSREDVRRELIDFFQLEEGE